MKWITRENAKADSMACAWLIKKFVDPEAEFCFAPEDQVAVRAKELAATAFAAGNHEPGNGDGDVSFNLLLKQYQLMDPALMLFGEIIRAAELHPSNPHPAGEGLRWLASGFQALGIKAPDVLQRQLVVCEALYAECRRRAAFAGFF